MRTGWFSQRTQPHANERNKISKESSGNWQPKLSDFLGEIPRGILWVVFSEGLRKTWYHFCSQMNTHSCFDRNNAYLRWTMLVAPVTVRIFHKCLSFRWTVPVSNNWQSCEGMQFFLKGPCMFWICIDRYCSCQLHLRQHFKSRLHCLNNDPHSRVAIESNQTKIFPTCLGHVPTSLEIHREPLKTRAADVTQKHVGRKFRCLITRGLVGFRHRIHRAQAKFYHFKPVPANKHTSTKLRLRFFDAVISPNIWFGLVIKC